MEAARRLRSVASLSAAHALAVRMHSLLLTSAARGFAEDATTVGGVVTWFGAMQSQDYSSGLWSLGARLPSLTSHDVEAALERREVLRTWPMRGTVHLVPSVDARWMLDLTGQRALARAARRRAALGLDEPTAERALDVLAAALAGVGPMTRAACVQTLEQAGVPMGGQRAYHLLWYASQRGLTCMGPNAGATQTFVLLDDWAPDQRHYDRDEALATLACRYVRSHGPVSRQDFVRWSGLTAGDARRAIDAAGEVLTPVDVAGSAMLAHAEVLDAAGADPTLPADHVRVLPGFDEYLLGYKDRSLMLDAEHGPAVVPGGNGVFQPTLVRSGRVVGTWRRTTGRARTTVTAAAFDRMRADDRTHVETAFEAYARFLARPVDVRWA